MALATVPRPAPDTMPWAETPGATPSSVTPSTEDAPDPTAEDSGPQHPEPRSLLARGAAIAGSVATLAYVGLSNPSAAGSVYPPCPSRLLFGLDCPGCGGLRGTHDLLHGDIVGALDHNVLLPLLLVICAYAAALVAAPMFGRHIRPIRPPRWGLVAGAAVLVGFMVVRNLPVAGLEWLASGAA